MKRESNFELLRILSMFMIVVLHYLGKGGILDNTIFLSINWFIAWMVEALCIVAVNCFVLLTGYFLVNSKMKIKKVVTLWLQVFFYSIIISFFLHCLGIVKLNTMDIVSSLLPVLTSSYWFITVYMALYLFSPFINICVRHLTKQQYKILIILVVFIFSIWKTILPFTKTLDVNNGYSIMWFVSLYLIGGYIRLYGFEFEKKLSSKNSLILYLFFSASIFCTKILLSYIIQNFDVNKWIGYNLKDFSRIFYSYNSLLVLLSSLSFFYIFKNIKIANNKTNLIINKIGCLTLGVYLIHEHPLLKKILWLKILKIQLPNSSFLFISQLLIICMSVFIVCLLIEYLRSLLFYLISKISIISNANVIISNLDHKYDKIMLNTL